MSPLIETYELQPNADARQGNKKGESTLSKASIILLILQTKPNNTFPQQHEPRQFCSWISISVAMDAMVNKFKAKYNKVKEELNRWEELQSRLVSQFRNASYIIDRLQLLQSSKNYGDLNCISGITEAVLAKQMQSLENIFLSMRKTLEEFHGIVLFLAKSDHDGRQLVKGRSSRPTMKQLQQRVGIKPRLVDCLDGLSFLHDIHYSEYQLKLSLVSALSANALKFSSSDLGALQQLLVDQPNIQREEVQFVFDIIFVVEE